MDSGTARSFLLRLLALPFSPRLWRESPEHGAGALLVPLVVWALAAGVVSGVRIANVARERVYELARDYEANADPLLLDQGRFSLTGERILQLESTDGSSLFLIDPAMTIPDAQLRAESYVVVRADRVVLQQPGQRKEWTPADVARLFGEHVLFDADWLRRAADRWVYPGLLGGFPPIAAFVRVAVCTLYASAVGLLLLLLRGQWLGLGYAQCVTVALATSAFTIAADLALTLFGVELPVRGYVLWPLVMAALGFVALAGRRAPQEP